MFKKILNLLSLGIVVYAILTIGCTNLSGLNGKWIYDKDNDDTLILDNGNFTQGGTLIKFRYNVKGTYTTSEDEIHFTITHVNSYWLTVLLSDFVKVKEEWIDVNEIESYLRPIYEKYFTAIGAREEMSQEDIDEAVEETIRAKVYSYTDSDKMPLDVIEAKTAKYSLNDKTLTFTYTYNFPLSDDDEIVKIDIYTRK